MVQGENRGNRIVASCDNYGKDSKSKPNGFFALQKHVVSSKSSKTSSSSLGNNQKSDRTKDSNWGPFKDRNDFVNMHFC